MKPWDRIIAWITTPLLFAVGSYAVVTGRLLRVKQMGGPPRTMEGLDARLFGALFVGISIYWAVKLLRDYRAGALPPKKKEPNQPPQRNAGSRPSAGASPASETPSSLGPRG